jgi:hypothetical protein
MNLCIRTNNMMKSIFIALSILIAGSAFSQDNPTDDWMKTLLGESVLSSLPSEKIAYYEAADQIAYRIEDVAPKDISNLPNAFDVEAKFEGVLSVEEAIASNRFHYMLYNFSVKNDEFVYYRLGDSNLMLVIYSAQYTFEKINNAQ